MWPNRFVIGKRKKDYAALFLSITIVGIIFSPLPGIDAVSIITNQINNNSIAIDITVRDPAAIVFPDGSTAETIPSNNLIRITLNGGTENEQIAFFDMSGNFVSGDTLDISSFTLDKIVKTSSINGFGYGLYGNYGNYGYGIFDYGNFYGYGYGFFFGPVLNTLYGYATLYGYSFGYGTIGDGSIYYGLTSNTFGMDTTGKYTLTFDSTFVGSHTINAAVLVDSDSNQFFSSLVQSRWPRSTPLLVPSHCEAPERYPANRMPEAAFLPGRIGAFLALLPF